MDRVKLTADEAIAMLPDGEMLHTFRSPGANILLGCDWARDEIIDLLRTGEPELSGEQATAMKHGLVVWSNGYLFIETKGE